MIAACADWRVYSSSISRRRVFLSFSPVMLPLVVQWRRRLDFVVPIVIRNPTVQQGDNS